jgi:hypothetical protein
MDAESAAVQGYAWALGRRVVLYVSSRRRMCSVAGYRTQQNVMIFHSAHLIVESLEAIPRAVQQVLSASAEAA